MNLKKSLRVLVTTGASLCTGYTIDKMKDGLVPGMSEMPTPAKIAIKAGSWLIGAAVGQFVGEQTEKTYDQLEEAVTNAKKAVEEAETEAESEGKEAVTA